MTKQVIFCYIYKQHSINYCLEVEVIYNMVYCNCIVNRYFKSPFIQTESKGIDFLTEENVIYD